jgi:hypothetical protein
MVFMLLLPVFSACVLLQTRRQALPFIFKANVKCKHFAFAKKVEQANRGQQARHRQANKSQIIKHAVQQQETACAHLCSERHHKKQGQC